MKLTSTTPIQVQKVPKAISWAAALVLACSAQVNAAVDLLSIQPPSVESTNGNLSVDLNIQKIDTVINNHQVVGLKTYNGIFPGPTLRPKAGDTMHIRYINRLPPEPAGTAQDHTNGVTPHGFNTMNLHTHGMNLSPEGWQDNVLLEIPPGYYVPYSMPIPTNHPSGFFWYHPHKHGAVNNHLASGLCGAIMVTGSFGDLNRIPEVTNAQKVVVILNQLQLAPTTNNPSQFSVPEPPLDALIGTLTPGLLNVWTVNGYPVLDSERTTNHFLPLPEIHLRPGEVQRWQVLHAGLDRFLWLTISDDAGGVGLPMNLLSFDGITLPSVDIRTGIFLSPANRAEFLIKGGAPGTYTLRSIVNPDPGFSDDRLYTNVFAQLSAIPFVKIIVDGAPTDMPLPSKLNPPIERLPDVASSEISRTREIDMNMDLPFVPFGTNAEGFFLMTIDDKVFDPNRVDQILNLNSAEEWTLRVTDDHSAHPFHIHVNWFQVVAINGIPLTRPRWQDTVAVPKDGQTVTIRHRFQNFPGKFVMHCHIVRHEDVGMMALVNIIDPKNFLYGQDADDPEGDGFPNIYHYAFGFPAGFRGIKQPPGYPIFARTNIGNQTFATVKFNRNTDPLTHLNYVVEASNDLDVWQRVTTMIAQAPVTTSPPSANYESVTLLDSVPINGPQTKGRFLRMKVYRTDFSPLPIPPGLAASPIP